MYAYTWLSSRRPDGLPAPAQPPPAADPAVAMLHDDLISLFADEGRVEEAAAWLHRMKLHGCQPAVHTCAMARGAA